jgi:hypothetical protein
MTAFARFLNERFLLVVLLLCAVLTGFTAQQIDGGSIKGDATQNLFIAFNLYDNGNFAKDGDNGHYLPTNLREPLPPAVVALYLKLVPPAVQPMTAESLHFGANTRYVKLSNLLWVFLGMFGSWLLFHELTGRRVAGLAAVVLTSVFFFHNKVVVNALYTELQAGALLIWMAWLLLRAMRQPSAGRLVLAGAVAGLLCLTKAVFLYAAPLGLLVLALCWVRDQGLGRWPGLKALTRFMAIAMAGFALVVGPWIARNQALLGTHEISSGRSGYVLFKRALLDQMTPAEFKGGFYWYGPNDYQMAVAGTSFAITREDAIQRDGRVARLNGAHSEFLLSDKQALYAGRPDQVVSFYNKSAAVFVQLVNIFRAGGHAHPEMAADQLMQKVALQNMLAHPLDHLKVSALLFWRGLWCISPVTNIPFSPSREAAKDIILLANVGGVLSLLVVFGLGLRRRSSPLLALTVLPVTMMGFYALLSQNLPRFTAPALPIMLICLLVLVHAATRRLVPLGAAAVRRFAPRPGKTMPALVRTNTVQPEVARYDPAPSE